jgi:hypothetical protein
MHSENYEQHHTNAVDHAERELIEQQRLYDLNMPSARNADATHPRERALEDAKAHLKAMKGNLARFRKLDHENMAARIAELRASASREHVIESVAEVRPKLVAAALLRLEAWVHLVKMDQAFRDRVREAQLLENQLLGTDKTVNFHTQPGFGEFKLRLDLDDVLAEIERLVDSGDVNPLRAALKRDERGKLTINGMQPREALSLAGI